MESESPDMALLEALSDGGTVLLHRDREHYQKPKKKVEAAMVCYRCGVKIKVGGICGDCLDAVAERIRRAEPA